MIYIVAMKERGGGDEVRGWGERARGREKKNIWINIWFSGGAAYSMVCACVKYGYGREQNRLRMRCRVCVKRGVGVCFVY